MRYREWLAFALYLTVANAQPRPALVADILSTFSVKRCIWFDNKLANVGQQVKQLSERNIMVVALNHSYLTHRLLARRRYTQVTREAVVIDFISLDWRWFHPNQEAHLSSLAWIVFFTGSWDYIQRLHVPHDCVFFIVVGSLFGYEMFEFYSLKGYPFIRFFGYWTEEFGLVRSSSEPFYQRRSNFNGAQLVLLRNHPWTYSNDYEKSNLDIWFSMGKLMNFSTRVVTQNLAEELAKNEGIYPDVSSQVTVFHSTALTQNPLIYYSIAPIWKISMFMYVQHETDGMSQWTAYLRGFHRSIWIVNGVIFILSSLCLIIILKTTLGKKFRTLHIVECGFASIDIISNQCGSMERKQLSHRVVIAVLRLHTIVLFYAFSGMLTSSLTLQFPKYPFRDLPGFVAEGSYKLGAINSTFGIGYFQYSNHPIDQLIATKLFVKEDKLPTSAEVGLRRCCSGHFAFLGHENVLNEVGTLPCRILKIPTPVFTAFAGMALAPFSEFKPIFFANLIRMQASGIIHKLKTTHHTIEIDSDYYSVNWDQILLILTVLMVGVLLSSIILLFEQCLGRNRKKNDPVLIAYDGLCYSFTESEQKVFINFAYTNTKKKLQPKAKQQK